MPNIKSQEAKHRKEAATGRNINTNDVINLSNELLDDDLV